MTALSVGKHQVVPSRTDERLPVLKKLSSNTPVSTQITVCQIDLGRLPKPQVGPPHNVRTSRQELLLGTWRIWIFPN